MTAATRAYNRKVQRETDGMSKAEKKQYMLEQEKAQALEKKARELESKLFPELYDQMYDSFSDAKMRRQGKNPMSTEYTEKVNARRKKLGFKLLGDNGLPVDSTLQYCRDLIAKKKR